MRDFAHEVILDDLLEKLFEVLQVFVFRVVCDLGVDLGLPVALDVGDAVFEEEGVCGGETVDRFEHGVGAEDEGGEVVEGCFWIERLVAFGIDEQCFDFGSECEGVVVDAVVEGLDPESVAREEEGAIVFIPDGEGKHAAQFLGAVGAVFFVGVEDDFSIGVRFEAVAFAAKLFSEDEVVVDFAVEYDPAGVVFICDGLVATRDINDAKSSVSESDGAFDVEAFIVGPAVCDQGGHVLDEALGDGAL